MKVLGKDWRVCCRSEDNEFVAFFRGGTPETLREVGRKREKSLDLPN